MISPEVPERHVPVPPGQEVHVPGRHVDTARVLAPGARHQVSAEIQSQVRWDDGFTLNLQRLLNVFILGM